MTELADAPGGPWNHAFVTTPAGYRVHYVHDGPEDGLPVVLVHGWPDLWFGWRRQIKALAPKYRLIVPDLRGFGQSSTPKEVEAYGTKNISDDLAALLDALDIEKAVFIGHDWGGAMVWRMCLYHPTRVVAVCGVCTPYFPPSQEFMDLDGLCKLLPPMEYQKLLADTERAAKLLDAAPHRLFTSFFRYCDDYGEGEDRLSVTDKLLGVVDSPHWVYTKPSPLVSEEELQYYVAQYRHSGFQSNCNFYGTRKIDFDTEQGLPTQLTHRALFIGVDQDTILTPEMAQHMPHVMPNVQMKEIKNAAHWVLVEQAEAVNDMLLQWLGEIQDQDQGSAVDSAVP